MKNNEFKGRENCFEGRNWKALTRLVLPTEMHACLPGRELPIASWPWADFSPLGPWAQQDQIPVVMSVVELPAARGSPQCGFYVILM